MNIYLVYEKYHKDFIAFARSIVNDHNEAFDLVQDAYVKALEREEIFEIMNEYQIKGWFFTTIKNKNIDNIRRQHRLKYEEEMEIYSNTESFEENIVLNDLLNKLPDKYRKVISLKYGMNLNSVEIGERLGISPSTVRSQLSEGRRLLKNMYRR